MEIDPDNSTSISGAFYGPSLAIAYQECFGNGVPVGSNYYYDC